MRNDLEEDEMVGLWRRVRGLSNFLRVNCLSNRGFYAQRQSVFLRFGRCLGLRMVTMRHGGRK